MKRSSRYTLKFATQKKKELLNQTFEVYGYYLQKTIDLMWTKQISLKKKMSSKQITWMDNLGGQYKDIIYQKASQIVRSCRFKKGRKNKPIVKHFCIDFTQNQIKVEPASNSYDKWLRLKLPFVKDDKKKERIEILIPLKEHRHSLKFKDWKQAKTIKLSPTYAIFTYEKETPKPKDEGEIIGLDSGYKNLLTTSKGQFIGKGFDKTYEKITRKRQGSKAFKRALIERNQKVNQTINRELDLANIKEIRVENLKNLKKNIKGKFRKEFNNKFQRWNYGQVLIKLERKTEEEAVQFTRIPPAYTSQTCPQCHFKHKKNRVLERFKCLKCGYSEHADIVGAINIASQEFYVPDTTNIYLSELNR